MDEIFKNDFYNPTCGILSLDEVIGEMIKYMEEKPERFYDIIIGCDSSSGSEPTFPVAVAILRTGEGGRFFLKKIRYSHFQNKKFINWKNRILQEVLISCDLALSLRQEFKKRVSASKKKLNYQFLYIHADIGEKGKTKDMVKELTSLIRGNGFEPKIKPESCIATTLADRYS
jgi:hypothetical protein